MRRDAAEQARRLAVAHQALQAAASPDSDEITAEVVALHMHVDDLTRQLQKARAENLQLRTTLTRMGISF